MINDKTAGQRTNEATSKPTDTGSDRCTPADKDRFRKAFSAVKPQPQFANDLEAAMTAATNDIASDATFTHASQRQRQPRAPRARRAIIAACTALAVVTGGGAAYAANVGGIQRTVQTWMHGDLTTATMVINEDEGSYELYDQSGNNIGGGGGIAYEKFGGERPLTADELAEFVESEPYTEITTDESGRTYLTYNNQTIDITDSAADDGYYYVTIQDGDETLYMTIYPDGSGYSSSPERYPIPGKDFEVGEG